MFEKTIGVFYDGESSKPHDVELFFDRTKKIIFFETSNKNTYQLELEGITMENIGTTAIITYGKRPIYTLKIENSNFITAVGLHKTKKGFAGWYQNLINLGFKFHITIAFAIIGIVGLSYLYVIPWVAEKSVLLIPKEYDDTLGTTFYEKNSIFNDLNVDKTENLNLFAKEIKLNNTKPLKFTVINSDIVNAFALPDGNIVVYSGILDKMKNYEELVALLGHEASHVNNRHSMKAICRNLSGYLLVSVILGDANGVMAVIGNNANNLQSLSFSRDFESEADNGGFKILTENKINPKGMSDLFKRLEDNNFISVPEFLSTHPLTKERIRSFQAMIKNNPYQFTDNIKLKKIFQEIKK